jgi:alpha-beta hydrolase superfamily lysophospholipase
MAQDGEIQNADATLFYHAETPESPKAILIIVHGLSEHGGRYLKLQKELAAEGFASWAYDQRGFGRSTGERTYVTHYNLFLQDLKKVISVAKEAYPGLPVYLIGHSLGGLVVATFCIKNSNDANGAVLSAPAYAFFPLPRAIHAMAVLLNYLCPKRLIRYPSSGDRLSHDPEIGRSFRQDPLIQSAGTPRFYHEFRKMNEQLRQHADWITLPTLILQGTDDTTVVPEGASTLYNQIGSKEKRLIFYDGFYHECFNEIGRERVVSDMIGWLNERVQAI